MRLDRPEDAIAATQAGKMVVIVDDETRENEGDLVMAAELAGDDDIAFMIRHTSGIICAPLEAKRARDLQLFPMVQHNDAPLATAFTVTVDCRFGLTTGISAKERCRTLRALADDKTAAADFVRPGHVFPLIASEGGVLIRSGHTEAAVDLARLAGLTPVGVIAELVNDDGTVKKGKEIFDFAGAHDLPIISIEDLISYRQQRENFLTRIHESEIETAIGTAQAVVYRSQFSDHEHLALIFGTVSENIPVRLQNADPLQDVFAHDNVIARALQIIAKHGSGVIIYLGNPYITRHDDTTQPHRPKHDPDRQWREIGLGAQILRDIGLHAITLLASKKRQYVGLHGFGIEVKKTVLLKGDR